MIYEALVQSFSNALAVTINDVKASMISKAFPFVERDKNGVCKATQPLAKDSACGLSLVPAGCSDWNGLGVQLRPAYALVPS